MDSMADLGTPLFIDVEGVRIRYVRSSDGNGGTPVLLVSPFPESLYAFDEISADLAQRRRSSRSTCRGLVNQKAAQS